ncbi:MAG: glycosyl hydrolase [Caldilineaceae bacterium]
MSESAARQALLQAMKFRCIGPPRGGRVLAVAGHPTQPMTFYFGGCAGGIWKTVDGGVYWENISDGFLQSSAVGALTVSEADPNVIYAGMGEATFRLDVSFGDGVYKSTDGGKTWRHMGLAETKHIAKIRVHPRNPDLVYVAAIGHAFGSNAERGVYRSADGGKTWELILHKSANAGAVDLTMDPTNPRILSASIYQVRRSFWNLESGGPESGLWKSTDGGDTWTEITQNKGLPAGPLGKIGVTISPASPNRVWVIIEAKDKKTGMYRSDDGGDTWKQVSDNRDLIHRPWYYCHVFADPQDANVLYVNNLKMWKSTDGGATYTEITTPHGDNHDLWIDPANPQRMVQGNDGGACVSFNGGASWSSIYNQKTAQFYHVAVDNRYPYHVYGTQQDNSSLAVPSASEKGGITWGDCYAAGTGESGYIAVHPEDPNIVYVGAIGSSPGGGNALQRYDHRTKQIRLVTVWPEAYFGMGAKDHKYRFAWTYPIMFSPHDANVLYVGGNHVFRTTDEGSSWQAISPDLSRNDESKLQPPGGQLTLDTSGAETYATVFALAESPLEQGVLWAGTDDGLVHISRNGGGDWQAITPAALPEWALVSMIDASPHKAGAAYLSATRYKLDDYQPYLFRTDDYGASWTQLSNFPAGEITRCIRVDPKQPGLLFVGTETGVFFSPDNGDSWQRLQNNLPVAPVYDLLIKEDDLVIGTHGRSFWILDDITPLREIAAQLLNANQAHLCAPRLTYRQWLGWYVSTFRGPGKNYMMSLGMAMTFTEEKNEYGEVTRNMLDAGENPPFGVIIYYALPADLNETVSLTILDEQGAEIRTYGPKPSAEAIEKMSEAEKAQHNNATYLTTSAGLNRFVWNMRYPDCFKPAGEKVLESVVTGPVAKPGRYQARLQVGDQVQTQAFKICIDPGVGASQADMDAQFKLWESINVKLTDAHKTVDTVRRIRSQVEQADKRHQSMSGGADSEVHQTATQLIEKLTTIEEAIFQTKATNPRDRLRMPAKLSDKLVTLISVVASCDAAPTTQSHAVYGSLASQVDEQVSLLDGLIGDDLAAFNDLMRDAAVPSVVM